MTRANLLKATIIATSTIVVAVILAAPLVVAQSKTTKQATHGTRNTSTDQVGDQAVTNATGTSNSGVHWASIATNNGTPKVRQASDGSTSATPDSGTKGAYTVTFPSKVHVLACTATRNHDSTQNVSQGMVSCGLGDDVGLKPNQVEVRLSEANNDAATPDSNFTVAAYDTPSS